MRINLLEMQSFLVGFSLSLTPCPAVCSVDSVGSVDASGRRAAVDGFECMCARQRTEEGQVFAQKLSPRPHSMPRINFALGVRTCIVRSCSSRRVLFRSALEGLSASVLQSMASHGVYFL